MECHGDLAEELRRDHAEIAAMPGRVEDSRRPHGEALSRTVSNGENTVQREQDKPFR